MVLNTWTFSKDKNSTAQPSGEASPHNITLKNDCSVVNPVFILNYDSTPTFNYCQYITFYYFVDDVVMRNKNVYEIHCTLDVLATYKSDIIASSQFVLRSTSDYNSNLNDSVFEPQLNPIISMTQTTSTLNQDGTYIAKLSSATSSQFGVDYYCGSKSDIGNLIGRCYNLNNWDQFLTTGLESLQKTVFDFSQYIQEIYWLPVSISDIPNKGGTGSTVFIGAWQLQGGSGNAQWFYGDYVLNLGVTISVPSRYYGDFRDYSTTYTQFILDIPGTGSINLDPKDVYGGLEIQYAIDLKTGDAKHVITTDSGNKIITTIRCNYKIPISYATFNNNFVTGANQMLQSVGDAVGSVGSGISGNYGGMASGVASGVTNAFTGIVNMGSITSHQCSSQGSMSDVKTNNKYSLTRYVHSCSGQPIYNIGRKLNEYRTLSTLSGFCQCQNAKLDTSAYGTIKDEILNHLNSGFFLE